MLELLKSIYLQDPDIPEKLCVHNHKMIDCNINKHSLNFVIELFGMLFNVLHPVMSRVLHTAYIKTLLCSKNKTQFELKSVDS